MLIEQYCARYGAAAYYDPTRYPTSDGYVPAHHFVRLSAAMPHGIAAGELVTMRATALAIVKVFAGKPQDQMAADRAVRELQQLAYPVIREPLRGGVSRGD